MTGVAVKVTAVPAQKGLVGVAIDTEAGNPELTIIVIALEVAGLPLAQVALEVSTQVMISLLERISVVKTGLFVPAFTPFFFH